MINPASKTPRALEGVKVLDLSRVLAGPWCTQILADLGAEVLKVEHPGRGDDTRAWGPPFLKLPDGSDDANESAYYLSANRNKRSAAIDLATPEGAALIRRLAAEADVLVENFKVGGLAKYGLDYAEISAINPAIVYCSITGFGQTGPYAKRGGYDFVAQGMGGFMSVTGEEHGGPLRAGVAMADLSTGNFAAISILAALRHADPVWGRWVTRELADGRRAADRYLAARYADRDDGQSGFQLSGWWGCARPDGQPAPYCRTLYHLRCGRRRADHCDR